MRPTQLAALAGLLAAPSCAQDAVVSSANPTTAQCDAWIAGMLDADADGSGGLSGSEFASFLGGIEEPPYLKRYFDGLLPDGAGYGDLPWMFQVIFQGLACRCHDLGMGEGCCESDGAEVPLAGLASPPGTAKGADVPEPEPIVKDFRSDLCAQVAYSLDRAVGTPSPTPGPTSSPTASPTSGPTSSTSSPAAGSSGAASDPAATLRVAGSTADYTSADSVVYYIDAGDVADNKDDNQVLSQFSAALRSLSTETAGDIGVALGRRRALRGGTDPAFGKSDLDIANEEAEKMRIMQEEGGAVEVADIGESLFGPGWVGVQSTPGHSLLSRKPSLFAFFSRKRQTAPGDWSTRPSGGSASSSRSTSWPSTTAT